ncbi:stress-responsive transcription factor hsf1 [Mortierella hygrophila]|uniref:Stress-responsive transcription factor hsf1 n=1 Tax=Mortierella hygrophila TaxID=979708 RepID=A0A9P6F4D0_9FUNG|nr:stress-responsive transcription factor hsf1 [Mortierella hygrophila]
MTLAPETALALIQAGASSSSNINNNTATIATPTSAATTAATAIAASATAPAQPQGPSMSMPNANNMLVNGRGNAASTSRASSSRTASASSSSSMQQLPRPSSTARGNVAAFLTKLYNMVGDEASNNLIKWSDDGHSFIVVKHVEFAKEVLPKFFKHNNFSSFVRQLNMYGFHKVPHLQQGVLLPDADSEQWEFSNPHFQKNQPDLLCLVSRKKASNGNDDKDALTMDLGHILSEVTAIKKHQIAISSDLKNIERDHQSLWQESIAARERHQRQQDTIDKILRFLASVFSGEKKRAIVPNKKPRLTITEGDVDDEYEHELGLSSGGEHEEEVTKLLGSKRKRASMVESEADYVLPGMETRGSPSKPIFNISEMTPATLALLANASQSAQSAQAKPSSPASTSTSSISTPPIATTSTAPSKKLAPPPATSEPQGSITDYLSAFPGLNFPGVQPFKLDGSNLSIPTTLLPNAISPLHHDMLRSISMANAQENLPAPLPPSFVQTPAGANAVKGVDQIAQEMEQLQKSIEALEAHGLNVNDFNFDESYLNSANFADNGYGDMSGISGSGIPYQDSLGSEADNMDDMIHADQDDLNMITPALDHQHIVSEPVTPSSSSASTPRSSSNINTIPLSTHPSKSFSPLSASSSTSTPVITLPVSAASTPTETPLINPRTSTVGDEYLEDMIHLDDSV